MTRAEYLSLADRVEREGITPAVNEAVALALGWKKKPNQQWGSQFLWRLPKKDWQTDHPRFTNLQTVADHTLNGWVLLTLGEFTDRWECELAKGTTVVSASAPTEAAARIAAILRAKGAETDAVS